MQAATPSLALIELPQLYSRGCGGSCSSEKAEGDDETSEDKASTYPRPKGIRVQKLVLLDGLQDASPTSAIAVHGRDANEKENDLCRQMLRSTDTYLLQEAR